MAREIVVYVGNINPTDISQCSSNVISRTGASVHAEVRFDSIIKTWLSFISNDCYTIQAIENDLEVFSCHITLMSSSGVPVSVLISWVSDLNSSATSGCVIDSVYYFDMLEALGAFSELMQQVN